MAFNVSTINGIMVGNSLTIPSITCVISVVNVEINVGAKSLTALIILSITVGNTDTILLIIGMIFFMAPLKLFARLSTSFAISAFELPSPAIKFVQEADKLLNEPSMVSPASSAVVPVIPNSC